MWVNSLHNTPRERDACCQAVLSDETYGRVILKSKIILANL